MSVIDLDLVRWSPRRWWLTIALFFVLQIAVIFWISALAPALPGPRAVPAVRPFDAASAPEAIRQYLDAESPFLFSSADWRGFSGPGWLRPPPMRYEPPEASAPPNHLSYALPAVVIPISTPPLQVPGLLAARPDPIHLLGQAPPSASTWLLTGAIRDLPLLTSLEPPSQRHSELVGSSRVEIGVGPEGLVISSRLVESSGLPRADQEALGLARGLRFGSKPGERRSGPAVTWGELHIQWHTLSLEGTNAPAR